MYNQWCPLRNNYEEFWDASLLGLLHRIGEGFLRIPCRVHDLLHGAWEHWAKLQSTKFVICQGHPGITRNIIFATDAWLSRLGRYLSGLNGLVGSKSRIHQIIYVGEKTLRIFNFFQTGASGNWGTSRRSSHFTNWLGIPWPPALATCNPLIKQIVSFCRKRLRARKRRPSFWFWIWLQLQMDTFSAVLRHSTPLSCQDSTRLIPLFRMNMTRSLHRRKSQVPCHDTKGHKWRQAPALSDLDVWIRDHHATQWF